MFHRPKSDEQEKGVEEQQAAQQAPAASADTQSADTDKQTQTKTEATEEKAMSTQDQNQDNQNRSIDAPAGNAAFPQRAAQQAQAPRMPGTSYGSSYSSPASASSSHHDSDERKLVIGRGITMSGEIDSCDTLIVEGTVEAALRGAKNLDIAESGVFYGTVEIEEALIAGRFEGDITVNGRLTLASTASITGSISYKEMAMEAGAMIDGQLSPLGQSASSAQKAPKKKASKSAAGAKNDNAGDDNELPLAAAE